MSDLGDMKDIDLMEHADGERELELGDAPEARAKVEAIEHLGEAVRGHLELAADAVPDARFAAMWREIDKQLEIAATPTPAPSPSPSPSAWGGLTRWLDRKLGYIITGVASAGAVAAVALVLHNTDTSGPSSTSAPTAPTQLHAPAEIESLEAPGGTATVMQMDDEDGDATVIWVTPDDIEGPSQ